MSAGAGENILDGARCAQGAPDNTSIKYFRRAWQSRTVASAEGEPRHSRDRPRRPDGRWLVVARWWLANVASRVLRHGCHGGAEARGRFS